MNLAVIECANGRPRNRNANSLLLGPDICLNLGCFPANPYSNIKSHETKLNPIYILFMV